MNNSWNKGKIKDLVNPVTRKWNPADNTNSLPYVGLEHIETEQKNISLYGDSKTIKSLKNYFSKGDTLFGKLRPYLKKVAFADKDGICSTDIIPLRAKSNNDENFVYYLLSSERTISWAVESSAGNVMPRTSWKDLSNLKIDIPLLNEQKKIASVLNSVDEVIEITQKQISKLENLKIGTLNKFLIEGIGHSEFKESELGLIPRTWKVQCLKDICEKIVDRDHTTPTYTSSEEGYPIISPTNINSDMEIDFKKVKYISAKDHKKNRIKTDLLPNDIIFSRIGSIGKSYLIKESFYDFSILHSICQIRVKKDSILPNYLLWQMRTNIFKNRLRLGVQSIGVPDLGLGEIGLLKIPICSLVEQKRISDFLEKIHSQILLKKQKLFQIKLLKKSLMKDLLTGEVRVKL